MADLSAGIAVVFREAVQFLLDRLEIGDDEWERLVREADDAARVRARDMSAAMSRDILMAIVEAEEKGTTEEQFRRTFDAIARTHGWSGDNTEGWRSSLIFRTMTAQAAAAGRWRQIERLAAKRPWVRYITAGDGRVRPQHAAWHGVILRWDDPWWDTHCPPNGFNCRCHIQSLDDHALKRYGWTPAEKAPFEATEIRMVRGPDGVRRPKEIPAGIDPGFAFNPGKIGLKLFGDDRR